MSPPRARRYHAERLARWGKKGGDLRSLARVSSRWRIRSQSIGFPPRVRPRDPQALASHGKGESLQSLSRTKHQRWEKRQQSSFLISDIRVPNRGRSRGSRGSLRRGVGRSDSWHRKLKWIYHSLKQNKLVQ